MISVAAVVAVVRNIPGITKVIVDSRGNKSWTHTLIIPPFVLFTAKALLGGAVLRMALPYVGQIVVAVPYVSGLDYAAYVAPLLALFGQREYVEKRQETTTKTGGEPHEG